MVHYDDCIVFNLAKAYQSAHGQLATLLKPHGLTPIQALVLEAVSDDEGLSAGEIGRRLVLDGATLSGVLDRLADAGWIAKRPDESDRRMVRIDLTDQARGFHPTMVAIRQTVNEDITSSLDLEERVLLRRLLREIRK